MWSKTFKELFQIWNNRLWDTIYDSGRWSKNYNMLFHSKMFCKIFTHCRLLEVESVTPSIVSESLWPHGLGPASSSVHGILPARILEWVNVPFSRGSSQPRDQTQVSVIVGAFFTSWATREATSGLLKCGNSLEYHKSTSVSSYPR